MTSLRGWFLVEGGMAEVWAFGVNRSIGTAPPDVLQVPTASLFTRKFSNEINEDVVLGVLGEHG